MEGNIFKKGKMIITAGRRRKGRPRTEAECRARHRRLHPGTPLPPRGTGLRRRKK